MSTPSCKQVKMVDVNREEKVRKLRKSLLIGTAVFDQEAAEQAAEQAAEEAANEAAKAKHERKKMRVRKKSKLACKCKLFIMTIVSNICLVLPLATC